jgi:hypothetical protein
MATITFTDSIDGDFEPGIGAVNPTTSSDQQADPILLSLTSYARLTVKVPPPGAPINNRRTAPNVYVSVPEPILINGVPKVPLTLGRPVISGQALAGIGHMRGFPNPDPVYSDGAWVVPPPASPAGSAFLRWSVNDLADPVDFANQRYLLGIADSRDGTTGYPANAQDWYTGAGSTLHIPWLSTYPFKPWVQAHTHYGKDGSQVVVERAVHFTPQRCSHMAMDFGDFLAPPFTVLITCIVTADAPPGYANCLFDAGNIATGLTPSQLDSIYNNGVQAPIAIPGEALGCRNSIKTTTGGMYAFNDPSPNTRLGRTYFPNNYKPKVLAWVVNGSSSNLYVRDTKYRELSTISYANHGPQRLWIMGRISGALSPDYGCSMAVFEIRAWDAPLTEAQLDAQYAQLSSTWKFDSYV